MMMKNLQMLHILVMMRMTTMKIMITISFHKQKQILAM